MPTIRNVSIYDGSGAPPTVGDLVLEGDRIGAPDHAGRAGPDIDATGLAVAPGFIDVHTHDDFAAVLHPDMAFKVRGGVTTCIVGNCGMGAAPFPEAAVLARAFHPHADLEHWDGYAGYAARLEEAPPSVNIGMLVGHGTLRMAAMKRDRGPPTPAQMRAMKATLEEGLEAGAFGLSTGLIYEPGRHARTEEIVELASLLQARGGLYATHMRDEGAGLLQSVEEAITIGELARVPVQISHHKASGRDAWGLVSESLRLIEAAQRRGLDVHADQYPYTAGSTILSAVVGAPGRDLKSLAFSDVVIASTKSHAQWEGRSLADLAAAFGTDGLEASRRILAAEPGATVIMHSMSEEDVRTVMRHPSTMIGSDGIPTLEGRPHPRLYGSFARVIGRYARELKLFGVAEAIHRMTGFPARKFGLRDRGVLREGAIADVVVFDPATIIDRGTFEEPNQYPEGIHHVFVNGMHTVANGVHTQARAGRVLRRA